MKRTLWILGLAICMMAVFTVTGCDQTESPVTPIDEVVVDQPGEDGTSADKGYHSYPSSWKFPFYGSYKITVGYNGNVCGGGHNPYHTGKDRFAVDWSRVSGNGDIGDLIPAPANGWATTGYSSSLGNYVRVYAGNGYSYLISHMDEIILNYCGWVSRGQNLGTVGCTGWCDGAHIHFVVYRNGTSVPQNGISGHQDLQLCGWYSSNQ